MFSNTPKTLYRFGMIVCVFAIAPLGTVAQQKIPWEAAVTPSELNVYADASTTTRVAMVLKQNYWVNVILEVNSSGIDWCRIEMPGEAEPAGYVFCKDLQQRGVATKASVHSDLNAGSPRGDDVTAVSSPPNSTEKPSTTAGVITNADILSMNKAGLPSSVLVAKIKSSACNFDTSPAQLQQLKAGGVPDDVILAMVEAPVGEPKRETADAPAPRASPVATAKASVEAASPVAPAKGSGYTVIYDGGSLPGLKSGEKMKVYIDSTGIRLMDDKGKNIIMTVVPSTVTEVSYGQDVHRRVGTAVAVGVFTLGLGALTALSKSKKHFVGLTWADGDAKGGFAMQCDKNDYRGVLAGLEGVTGKKAVDSEAMTVKN